MKEKSSNDDNDEHCQWHEEFIHSILSPSLSFSLPSFPLRWTISVRKNRLSSTSHRIWITSFGVWLCVTNWIIYCLYRERRKWKSKSAECQTVNASQLRSLSLFPISLEKANRSRVYRWRVNHNHKLITASLVQMPQLTITPSNVIALRAELSSWFNDDSWFIVHYQR